MFTPVPPHVRLPEYFTSQHSRPPTPNFAFYPIRVDGTTIYEPQSDPRFTILLERFNNTNDTLSIKRKEAELKKLQSSNLQFKFQVKVKINGVNPHFILEVTSLEHKTTPAPFIVTYIEVHGDPDLPDIAYCKIDFCNPYFGPIFTTSFQYNTTSPYYKDSTIF